MSQPSVAVGRHRTVQAMGNARGRKRSQDAQTQAPAAPLRNRSKALTLTLRKRSRSGLGNSQIGVSFRATSRRLRSSGRAALGRRRDRASSRDRRVGGKDQAAPGATHDARIANTHVRKAKGIGLTRLSEVAVANECWAQYWALTAGSVSSGWRARRCNASPTSLLARSTSESVMSR
jgi:hypothetical protein